MSYRLRRNTLRRLPLLIICMIAGRGAAADEPSGFGEGPIEAGHATGFVLPAAWSQPPAVAAQVPQAPSTPLVDPDDQYDEDGPSVGYPPEPVEESDEEQEGSDDDSLESLSERLKELEEEWGEYQEEIEKAASDRERKSSWKMTGRVHFDYWGFPDHTAGVNYLEHDDPGEADFGVDPEDRWVFRRIRLEFGGNVPDNMLFRAQIDFNRPAQPEYKDVYIGWNELPNNQVLLLGNQKRPIGLDHLNSSRFNVFAERPLVVEAFNEDARRIGLCMYGYNDAETLHWRYGIFALENTTNSGRLIGDSQQMGGYGRLAMVPWYDLTSNGRGYQHLALSGSVARPDGDASDADTNENEARFRTRPEARSDARWLNTGRIAGAEWFEQLGIESITNIGSLQITGEYMATFLQRDLAGGPEDDLAFHGGYIYASYFLTGEYIPYDRQSGTIERVVPHENFFLVDRCRGGTGNGWGAWQVAARYSYLDLSDSDVLGGIGHNVTLGLNWHWTPYSKMQSNLILGTIDSHEPVFDPTLGETFTGGDYAIFGTRFMLDW